MDRQLKADCAFCNSKEQVFAESENFLALYNLAPILPGHSLVIPKWHVVSLLELSDQEICEMVVFSKECIQVLMKAFGTNSFNWTVQEGIEAGQTISHLHLHIIPRKPNDLPHPGDWYPLLKEQEAEIIDSDFRKQLSSEEMKKIVSFLKMIRKSLASRLE